MPPLTVIPLFVATMMLTHFEITLGAPVRVMLLSDVHYDPMYGTSEAYGSCTTPGQSSAWGTPACDAPLKLVTSAINDAATQAPDLFLMSGDWLRHGFGELPMAEAIPTFKTVAQLMSKVMPNTSTSVFSVPNFQGALGNNDFIPDYHFNLSNPAHPLLLNQSQVLTDLQLLSAKESTTFGKCGYYSRTIQRKGASASSGLRVVVLNTIMYSVLLDPPLTSDNNEDPCEQLAFLQATLYEARTQDEKVVVVAHIPPGMNLYGVLSGGVNGPVSNRQFWFESFVTSFRSILSAYKDVVTCQFYGHTHMFSVVADTELGIPGVIVPSITRVFGNNPSYLIAEMDDVTWELSTLHQRYLHEDANGSVWWATANETVGTMFSSGVDENVFAGNASVLAAGSVALVSNDSLWAKFQKVHEGGITLNLFPTPPGSTPPSVKGACNSACKKIVLCSMLHIRWDAISACVAAPLPTPTPTLPPAGNPPSNNNVASGYVALYVMCAVLGLCGVAVVGRRFQNCAKYLTTSKPKHEGTGLVSGSAPRHELDSVTYDEGTTSAV